MTKKALRDFGWTVGGVLAIWCGLHFWKHGAAPLAVVALAALLLALGTLWPGSLRLAYHGWMGLALCLGWVVSRVLLAVIFYGMVTPVGLILRVCGKDLLQRRFDKGATSYWKDHAKRTRDSHTSQF